MKVAVLSLTRDRLEYTRHCFASLKANAGCEYDHYVLDQGSRDGSYEWVSENVQVVVVSVENLGISRGMNFLLDAMGFGYDVIVKYDNDCEVTEPGTLRDVCTLALARDALLSPRILGLRNPPRAQGQFEIEGEPIMDIPQIGGIFLATPFHIYERFRYDARNEDDDVQLCWWWRGEGGRCGYVQRLSANHYETTDGQWERYPDYFERRVLEGGRAW